MLPITRPGRALVAAATVAALLGTASAATAAVQNESTINGTIDPNKGPVGAQVREFKLGFTIDPPSGIAPTTLNRFVLSFPNNARINARYFATCTAAEINAARSYAGCMKGAKKSSYLGRGSGKADIPAIDTTNVPFTVTLFNGSRSGNRITVHVWALRPARVNLAFDATLKKTGGRYGYQLIGNLPHGLQEVAPGWFVGVRTFSSTIRAITTVRGKKKSFIEVAKPCPSSLSVPIAGSFGFSDGGSTSATGSIACRR